MGVLVQERFGFSNYGLTDQEFALVKAGLSDSANGKSKIEKAEIEKLLPKLQDFVNKKVEARAAKNKEAGMAYLCKGREGTGRDQAAQRHHPEGHQGGHRPPAPRPADTVKVHYTGKFIDGKVFDSSAQAQGAAARRFPLERCGSVLERRPAGGEGRRQGPARLPAQTWPMASRGRPPQMPGSSTLVFDVELLEIVKAPAAGCRGRPTGAAPADPHKATLIS